jgi:hypothetical protein
LLIREQDPRIDRLLSTLHVNRPPAEHDDLQATFDRNDKEIKDRIDVPHIVVDF